MMPVQKVLNIYKTSMDLKDKDQSRSAEYNRTFSSGSDKHKNNRDDSKNSFSTVLKKALQK